MSTVNYRKCESCGYFDNGWCCWLGKLRSPKDEECEDGFKKKNNKKAIVWAARYLLRVSSRRSFVLRFEAWVLRRIQTTYSLDLLV